MPEVYIPNETARNCSPQLIVLPFMEGVIEGSSVNCFSDFEGSSSWFLYFDDAKRLNGGISDVVP
jgi:hypothetical protein